MCFTNGSVLPATMVLNPITSIRRWIDRVVYNRTALDRLSSWELEKQNHRIGKKRDEITEEMKNVKTELEEALKEASEAEGHELEELKSEASYQMDLYERLRRQRAGMMQTQQWLQQMKLGKSANEAGIPDVMQELGVDPDNIEEIGKQVEAAVKDEEDRARQRGFQASQIKDAYQGGGQALNAISDDRIDKAIKAVRNGDGVPEIDSLVTDQSSSTVDPDSVPEDLD